MTRPARWFVLLLVGTSIAMVGVPAQAAFDVETKLTASDGVASDMFGVSVSYSGNTILVGATNDDGSAGSAYVYTGSGTSWTFQQKLTAPDRAAEDMFGFDVALEGDTAVVGAYQRSHAGPGAAYVFTRTGTTWTFQQKLTASDGVAGDQFGFSVALSGNTALIGSTEDDGVTGSAYVFTRTGTTWTQQQKITASDAAVWDTFGNSVALEGDTAVVGSVGDDRDALVDPGAAYVFTRSGTTWTEQQKLTASDAGVFHQFGWSVAISGETALVGAIATGGTYVGSAYVFTRSGAAWTQQQKLTASDGASGDWFGGAVAIHGDAALVGSLNDDSWRGSVHLFTRSGTTWTEQPKILASDGMVPDAFGASVALSGDTAVVGAYGENTNGAASGAVYVFAPATTTPPIACTIVGTPGPDVLEGTAGRDRICGLGGDDTISGLGGNDFLNGGAGDDTLNGGAGNDTLVGKKGNDHLVSGSGIDLLKGSRGHDSLNVADGAPGDTGDGGPGSDSCTHDPGDTLLNM